MTTSPVDLSQLRATDLRVARVLLACEGRANAMPLSKVAYHADVPARAAQHSVKRLVEEHGLPIGSAYQHPMGWYLCVTDAEREENRRALRSRALSILVRARAFDPRRFPHLAEMQGQLALDLEQAEDLTDTHWLLIEALAELGPMTLTDHLCPFVDLPEGLVRGHLEDLEVRRVLARDDTPSGAGAWTLAPFGRVLYRQRAQP